MPGAGASRADLRGAVPVCTLIALHRCVPGADLVVGANRDEHRVRPCAGPALRETAAGPVVAPRDRHAGGTWLGLNRAGVFAGITNRPTARPDPTRRSRGWLVMDTLAASSAEHAARDLEGLQPGAYNPFNLFVADARDAFAVIFEDTVRVQRLAPGVHVFGNADPNAFDVPKLGRVVGAAREAAREPAERTLDALARICRRHDPPGDPLSSPCVHAVGYGTRSSTLLRFGSAGHELRHAEGPPCRTDYDDLTALLDGLVEADEVAAGGSAARRAS